MESIHIELEARQRLRELIQAIKDVPDENDDEGTGFYPVSADTWVKSFSPSC